MTLKELFTAVKEQTLDRPTLENYRDTILSLYADMKWRMADLEKEEALFMHDKPQEQSSVDRKWAWKATPSGQELIKLKNYESATSKILSSLKDRIFHLI